MKSLTWPAWFNSPDGKNTEIFATADEVPDGWTSGAEKQSITGGKTAAPVHANVDADVDAAGHPFDPALHTGTKTEAGLWRMKPGVTRPETHLLDL